MTGSERPPRSRVTRAMDLLRERSGRKKNQPGIPWAKPRPRFDLPEIQPSSSAVDSDVTVYSTAASHLHEGRLGAASGEAAQTGEDARELPSRHASESSPSMVTRPIYSGFMGTVGVGIALLCYYIASNIGALAGWVTGAMFIALGLDPIVRWLERKGVRRGFGVVCVILILAGLVALLSAVVIPTITRQAVNFVTSFPNTFEDFLNSDFMTSVDERWGVRGKFDAEADKFFAAIFNDSNLVGGFLNNLVNAGSTIAQTVTGTLIVMFLTLYFLAALPTIKAWFIRLAPRSKRARVGELTEKITTSVGNYVMGQAVVATLNALFALTVMAILGIPYPVLNAFIVLLLAFVPLVGGVAAGILVASIVLLQGWQTALIYAICYFAYLQVEAYFISPRIMKRAVAVPAAVAVIAVAAGGALWGVLGALIAIPVAASGLMLVREVYIPRQDQR